MVIACATQGMIQQISSYYGHIEGRYLQLEDGTASVHTKTGEVFPAPWPRFRDEVIARLSEEPQTAGLAQINPALYSTLPAGQIKPVFVSRMPQHKVTGAAHKETIRSTKGVEDGYVVSKKPLTALTTKLLEDSYYKPQSDTLLYEALKARLAAYGGNAKKAFAEPFYKPKADGTPGPLVRKVKIVEKATGLVPVHGGNGVAKNATGSMVRVDVFYVERDGYYLVPIYVADTIKKQLPNLAIVQNKPWKPMREEDFLFSLYPNDLVLIRSKKEMPFSLAKSLAKNSTRAAKCPVTEALCYYRGTDRSTASIAVCSHDGAYEIASLGFKTLLSVEKYEMDVLGNFHKVKKEKRQTFR